MSDNSFIKEVIKKKPVNKRAVCVKLACLIGAAILFGVVAAITFANVLPAAQKKVEDQKTPSKIDIPGDEEEETGQEQTAETETPAVTPEVVEVPRELGLDDYKQFYQDMKDVSGEAKRSLVTVLGITSEMDYLNNEYENMGQLSGFIVGNNGKELVILTEYRVVDNVERILVRFCNQVMVDAQFQKQDRNTGLTVLKIPLDQIDQETRDAIPEDAPLGNSYSLKQGEPVIALGSPMGYSDSLAFGVLTSVTNKISTLDSEYSLLTTDILGSKEGSGILLNLEGEIVGMIAQSYSTESNTVTALSISQIKHLIEILSNNEPLPYVGIKGQDVTEENARQMGIPEGIYVNEVETDSPAMQEGVWTGDVIIKVGDTEVKTVAEYRKALEKCAIDQPVKITAKRQGAEGYVDFVFDVTVLAL